MKIILSTLLFSLTLLAQDKPTAKEFDRLLGYSCPPHEFVKRFNEAMNKNLPKGEYIRKTIGGDNFTHFLITSNPPALMQENLNFWITDTPPLAFKEIREKASICSHKDIKGHKVLSNENGLIKAYIDVENPKILKTRLIYTFNTKLKDFVNLAIAAKGEKIAPGKLIFDEKSVANLKKDKSVKPIAMKVDYGTLIGRQFRNKYFHCQLEIPENWHIENESMLDVYDTKTKKHSRLKSLKGDDKPSMKHLSISKEKPGDKFKKFPIFAVTSIPLPEDLKKKKSEEYLAILKEGFKAAPIKPEFIGEIKPVKIQNLDFAQMKFSIQAGDLPKAYQEYFLIVFKGRALAFILNYHDDEARKELQLILDSIKFSK